MSDRKRPFEGNGDAGASKKLKSDNAPAQGGSGVVTSADILAKRAEVAAKLAAFKKDALGWTPPVRAPVPTKPITSLPSAGTGTPGAPTAGTLGSSSISDIARRVAEAKAKLAASGAGGAPTPPGGKKPATPASALASSRGSGASSTEPQTGSGLKMAAHPLLLDTGSSTPQPQSKKDRYKPMQPKFATIKANVRNQPSPSPAAPTPVVTPRPESANPYTQAASEALQEQSSAPGGTTLGLKERTGRGFRFNPKGKYVAMGNQLRHEKQLEDLKARIAESARKAGLDERLGGVERGVKRAPPPSAEWWDESLLPTKNYTDLQDFGMEKIASGIRNGNIGGTGDASPVTIYIQHPIPIPAPMDKNKVEFKPLMLTTKEQKKMRKLRRASELQDKRDRIRMGLLPPDPPKVGLKNLMKVLTSDAVQDPTRVEARVRREVAMRRHNHEKMNAERKVAPEDRKAKIEEKRAKEEEEGGVWGLVFKIKILQDKAQKWKIKRNAEQVGMTGVVIIGGEATGGFGVVYVEGSRKSVRWYKKLMLKRIKWTEEARERGNDVEIDEDDEDGEGQQKAGPSNTTVNGEEEEGGNKISLEDNACYLIWEGQLRERNFNNLRERACATDRDAKEVLGEKLRGYWDVARNWKGEEEDLLA